MSSNLKVNTILPSTGTTIGIGTVGGLINVVGNIDVNSTSGISTFNGLEISGIVTAKAGAAVTYYGDGSNLTGISQVGGSTGVDFNDNVKARFGTGNDLEIFHDGSHSYITDNGGTGNLRIQTNNLRIENAAGTENQALFVQDGAVELYHNNSKKFETRPYGIDVHGLIETNGNVRPNLNNTHDLGTTSLRWRNIYTNDLNLSNEGSSNDVDGTWGHYTIQEGESDLFLINRRSGKKYKFNLTEVS